MNKIKQVKDYIDPTSPFKIRYNYAIDVNTDLDEVPEEYRNFVLVFLTLLEKADTYTPQKQMILMIISDIQKNGVMIIANVELILM